MRRRKVVENIDVTIQGRGKGKGRKG